MKSRLLACAVASLLVVGASIVASTHVLAQGGAPAQKSEVGRQNPQLSAEIEKALEAYESRSGRNLDQCRKEMEALKKELHELIDLRINMALSLAEIRAKAASTTSAPAAGGIPGQMQAKRYAGSNYPGASAGGSPFARPGGRPQSSSSTLGNELQQLHAQLRAEVDQQQNQVSQLVAQLRALQPQEGSQGEGQQNDQPKGTTEVQKK